MKKIIIIIVLAGLTTLSFGQKKHKGLDTLVWKQDYSLTKEDFKGSKIDKKIEASAYAYMIYYVTEVSGELKIKVEAIFDKSKSVMKSESAYALKYEQLSFDITELYARKLRKKLSETDFLKVKDIKEKVAREYKRVNEELGSEKNKFGKDTQNGLNSAKLDMWNENVQKELKELDAYNSTEVSISKQR